MGLGLSVVTPSEATATYHDIQVIKLTTKGSVTVYWASFVNQTAKNNGAPSINNGTLKIPISQIDLTQALHPQLYAILTAQVFPGAITVQP